MPTQEQLRQRTADIEREYPESLSDRIQWWARVLDIDRVRLFRLLGLSGSEAARTPLTALPRVVEAQVDQAEIVDDMLGQLLASFDYDLPALRTVLHEPVDTASEENRPGNAVPVRTFHFPTRPVRRCGGVSSSTRSSRVGRSPCALQAYLSEPTTGNGRRGKQTG